MSDNSENTWTEAIVAYFKLLSQHSTEETDENKEQQGQSLFLPVAKY
jgi:hypothetical protein